MGTNRLPKDQPDDPQKPVSKLVVLQTPMGTLQLMVPAMETPDGQDPLAVAMEMFQNTVERGADDPLMETLIQLKQMADDNNEQPLVMGLAVLKQMSDNGMLPPLAVLIEGTGITQEYVKNALSGFDAQQRPGVIENLDNINLN